MLPVHEKRISLQHGGVATLFIFGDTQFGSDGFDNEMWQEFAHQFKTTKNAYGIGLGDASDFLRPSMRARIVGSLSSDLSAREELDKIVRESVDKIYDKMSFMKDRIVGLHSGHHEWDFADGTNTTQTLCQKFNTIYLHWCAYTVLRLCTPSSASTYSMKIFSTHGSGGGQFSSSDLGNLERRIAPYWVADLYLRGHSSKLEMIPIELNDVTLRGPEPRLIKKTRWLVNCGGFMSGYVDKKTTYIEKNNMPPACLGWAKCEIRFSSSLGNIDGKKITGLRMQPLLCSPRNINND